MIWTKKYEPKNSSEVQGQKKAVESILYFVNNYKTQKKKALLLYGPTGSGKTSTVHAIAKELDLELIEINASDTRNAEQVEKTIGNASKQMSLFMKQKIILIDEVDGIAGREDRGGLSTIINIIKTSSFPIIITANNPFDSKFSSLRKVCETVEFRTLAYTSVYSYLNKICEKENIEAEADDLKALARRMGGDLRGAITDLQTLTSKTKKLDKQSLDELSGRHQTESMLKALMKIFKTTDPDVAITALDNVDEDLNKAVLWIDENLPAEYTKPIDLYRAYDSISKSDVFNGRIKRWQHWRFLVYINALLTAGVAIAKDEKYQQFIPYRPTSRILKLWRAKVKRDKNKAIAEKLSKKLHCSKNQIIKDTLPYLKFMMKNKSFSTELQKEFELDKEEIKFLS
ncbi:replication factor C large subunit [Candidatus Woesearchaeota archaeon]|nr:replication factor C large subunit [Candidatus Woesearchaeota archaeon]MBW3021576.1 replication factor C large subunit [Candidatus Woesearchaeota archaeon]